MVADEWMLEVFDNDSIHRILRVRHRDCVPSVELRRRLRLTSIPALLVQRRLRWFGHAARRPEGELIMGNHDQGRRGTALRTASLVSSHRTAEPGVPPSETKSTQLVMPAQPAPGECRRKYK